MVLSANTGAFAQRGDESVTGQQALTPEVAEAMREIRNIDSDIVDEMPQYCQ
jgi:hypothetical protein